MCFSRSSYNAGTPSKGRNVFVPPNPDYEAPNMP